MRRCVWVALALGAGVPTLLGAQGFGIYEQGACAMGRASTGVAAPCPDGSAMFFNPAGLAGLQGKHFTVGTTLISVHGGFTDDIFQQTTDINNPLLAVPQAYLSYGVTSKLGVGVGLFAPYGLETQWPTTFDGAFAGYRNIIRSVYLQPTAAYQVNRWLSVGAGFDVVFGSVELNQRLDLAQTPVPTSLGVPPNTFFGQFGIPPGTAFANVHLEASKTSIAGHVGALVKVTDELSFGANYLTKTRFEYSGTATFTQVPTNFVVPATIPLTPPIPAGTPLDLVLGGLFSPTTGVFKSQPVTTVLANPAQMVLGVAYKLPNGWTALGDYQYTWWSRFSELDLTFPQDATGFLSRRLVENYQNTSGFRVGAEWVRDAKWTFRGGYLYNQAAAPAETVTPLLPEGNRNEVTVGTTVTLSHGLSADLAYQYIHQNDRRGRTREPLIPPATTGLNNGLYTFNAHLFGVALSYAF